MDVACGEAMSVEGTKRTNVIAAATSALTRHPPTWCVGLSRLCECPENRTIQRVQLDFFHFSALLGISAQVYCKI